MKKILMVICVGLCIALSAGDARALTVKSTAFEPQGTIPVKYTGYGKDISPAVVWKDVPAKTMSFALICDDPDAPMGIWVHWVVYNIPATVSALAEGVARQGTFADGMMQGKNDFGNLGYGGPLPPPGKAHRYVFTVYALDTKLALPAGVTKQDLQKAMSGHILGQAQITGMFRYQKPAPGKK